MTCYRGAGLLVEKMRKARAYSDVYLSNVVENQGKLFDMVAMSYPEKNTEDFIETYMKSKTRKSIDESMAYVNTMDYRELWEYFCKTENFCLKMGELLKDLCRCGSGNFMHTINGIIIFQARRC